MKNWFVIYCKPKKDEVAEGNLLKQGFEVYRPRIIHPSSNSGAKSFIRSESLFPRYLFINLEKEKASFMNVSYTPGVLGLVKFGEKYPMLDDSVIRQIKSFEISYQSRIRGENDYKKGDLLVIQGGSLDNIEAVFMKECGSERAIVLLNILGRSSTVKVPYDYIKSASYR